MKLVEGAFFKVSRHHTCLEFCHAHQFNKIHQHTFPHIHYSIYPFKGIYCTQHFNAVHSWTQHNITLNLGNIKDWLIIRLNNKTHAFHLLLDDLSTPIMAQIIDIIGQIYSIIPLRVHHIYKYLIFKYNFSWDFTIFPSQNVAKRFDRPINASMNTTKTFENHKYLRIIRRLLKVNIIMSLFKGTQSGQMGSSFEWTNEYTVMFQHPFFNT